MNSLRLWWLRTRFNFYPCYRRTGARVTFIAPSLREIRLRLPLNWTTRGYWGTTFGGSIYGAVDPVYLVMLARNLGPDYLVWDKSASIQFKKPGRSTLFATFRIEETELAAIRSALVEHDKIDRLFQISLIDEFGTVCAEVEKVVHIRRRRRKSAESASADKFAK